MELLPVGGSQPPPEPNKEAQATPSQATTVHPASAPFEHKLDYQPVSSAAARAHAAVLEEVAQRNRTNNNLLKGVAAFGLFSLLLVFGVWIAIYQQTSATMGEESRQRGLDQVYAEQKAGGEATKNYERARYEQRVRADTYGRAGRQNQGLGQGLQNQGMGNQGHTYPAPPPSFVPAPPSALPNPGITSPGRQTPIPGSQEAQALMQRDLPQYAKGRSVVQVVYSASGNGRFLAAVTYSTGEVSQFNFNGSVWALSADENSPNVTPNSNQNPSQIPNQNPNQGMPPVSEGNPAPLPSVGG